MSAFINHILILSLVILGPCCLVSQDLAPEDKTISIYFGGGSYYIDEEQENDLVQFIEEVDNIAKYQIEVHGHTDNMLIQANVLSDGRSEVPAG